MTKPLYLAVIIPTDPTVLFTTEDGEPFRLTTSLWSSYGEAMEWGEPSAERFGTDDNGVPLAVCIVQTHVVDEFRREGSHGLN